MTSLSGHIATAGLLENGDNGPDVATAQAALSAAGYRIHPDGIFGDETETIVCQFQAAHGLKPDGIIGPITAALLDAPHAVLVNTATPVIIPGATGVDWPHDDTASMTAFYGNPSVNNAAWQNINLVPVVSPWPMFGGYTDDGSSPVKAIYFHKKAAPYLLKSLQDIWAHYKQDIGEIHRIGLHRFSGAYNYRPIRGSSRLSEHAFAVAIDLDSTRNPMTTDQSMRTKYPLAEVAKFFIQNGAFWGGNYKTRLDGMHFGWARE